MKKIISVLLVVVLLAFLVISNPTSEEFGRWYAQKCFPEADNAVDQLMENFTQYLAQGAVRKDYLVCSVYTYDGHTTLGIALQFIPVDELSGQVTDLRAGFAAWLEENEIDFLPNS